jgi:hypothetical protein
MKLPIKKYYNYTTDFLLLYGFLAIIISSYILWFVLPMGRGMGGDRHCDRAFTGEGFQGNQVFAFGFTRYVWVDIHSWISIAIIALILVHLIMHWQWIVETMRGFKDYVIKRQKAMLERYLAAFILFILSAFQVLSGCVLWIIMPRGVGDLFATEAGNGRTFW